MTDSFSPITPKSVPLSHAEPAPARPRRSGGRRLTLILATLLGAGLLAVVFFVVPSWLEGRPVTVSPATASPTAAVGETSPSEPADEQLPPFQQLQREQARTRAQEELSGFVELQIRLEDSMQVGAWGEAEYDRAKALAAAGDEQFVREQFEQAVTSYRDATAALEGLIERGGELLESSIEQGQAALAALDQDGAREAFEVAATIDPEDPRVVAGRERLARLPEIEALLREARNHELAGEWSRAESVYDRINDLDPQIDGLDEARTRVADGRREARVQALLSDAFTHLDAGRFDAARQSFGEVLDLAPGNAVAIGGLEQVTKRADVTRINDLRTRAETAVQEERWDDAMRLYGEVLELDATIRFAQSGRAQAQAQQRAHTTLSRIQENPDRLSSEKLYREARAILAQAESLEPRGPRLAQQIEDVGAVLDAYANPVPVVLRSDNRTEVTVSTVGRLGSFEEKRLELRPGAYTVIGSRDGCRDVREQIVVRPNMNPVDIRCTETL